MIVLCFENDAEHINKRSVKVHVSLLQ